MLQQTWMSKREVSGEYHNNVPTLMSEFLTQMQFLTGILNWPPVIEIVKEWNAVLKNTEYIKTGICLYLFKNLKIK